MALASRYWRCEKIEILDAEAATWFWETVNMWRPQALELDRQKKKSKQGFVEIEVQTVSCLVGMVLLVGNHTDTDGCGSEVASLPVQSAFARPSEPIYNM